MLAKQSKRLDLPAPMVANDLRPLRLSWNEEWLPTILQAIPSDSNHSIPEALEKLRLEIKKYSAEMMTGEDTKKVGVKSEETMETDNDVALQWEFERETDAYLLETSIFDDDLPMNLDSIPQSAFFHPDKLSERTPVIKELADSILNPYIQSPESIPLSIPEPQQPTYQHAFSAPSQSMWPLYPSSNPSSSGDAAQYHPFNGQGSQCGTIVAPQDVFGPETPTHPMGPRLAHPMHASNGFIPSV